MAINLRQVGNLERDKPGLLLVETLKVSRTGRSSLEPKPQRPRP
jgi:hypothetical protein